MNIEYLDLDVKLILKSLTVYLINPFCRLVNKTTPFCLLSVSLVNKNKSGPFILTFDLMLEGKPFSLSLFFKCCFMV